MKTAYELAMERLNKTAPAVALTEEKKKRLAELDSRYSAKLAEREIFINGQLDKARSEGDFDALEQLERQLVSDRKSIAAELEEKKERVRSGESAS